MRSVRCEYTDESSSHRHPHSQWHENVSHADGDATGGGFDACAVAARPRVMRGRKASIFAAREHFAARVVFGSQRARWQLFKQRFIREGCMSTREGEKGRANARRNTPKRERRYPDSLWS